MTEPKTELALATREDAAVAVRQDPTPGDMLKAVLDRGITNIDVAVVEKLTALYERMEDRKAEKQFAAAFVALQADMPKIQATRAVPNNDGGVRYRFAPFEDLMAQVGPALQKNGFTVSFANRYEGERLIETCTLQHIGGHKRSNDFAVRIGSGPPKATMTQADGAAATYAKRFALCDALNIVISHLDNDAAAEGAPITAQEAADLEARVAAGGVNRDLFLKFAGAHSFAEIPSARFEIVDEQLKRMCSSAAQPIANDPLKPLKKKLWDLCLPIRGPLNNWIETEKQLLAWKILPPGLRISDLKQADLEVAIDKAGVCISQMKPTP